jgi:hypothetical protein
MFETVRQRENQRVKAADLTANEKRRIRNEDI